MDKKYTSFGDIDRDLEILALEKEIHYQKLLQTLQDASDSIAPGKLLGSIPKLALDLVGGLSGGFKGMALSFLLRKIFK